MIILFLSLQSWLGWEYKPYAGITVRIYILKLYSERARHMMMLIAE